MSKGIGWKEFYRKVHPHLSERGKEAGIRDWEQRSSILLSWLDEKNKNIKILDCGCGFGVCGKILIENGFKNVIGVDRNEEWLKSAKTVHKSYSMDCQNLEFKDNSFDVVLGLNIMQYIPDTKKFFSEVKRVLKKDGILVLSAPNETFLRKLLGKSVVEPDHLYQWNYKSFKGFLRRNGWKVTGTEPIGKSRSLMWCNTFMVRAEEL